MENTTRLLETVVSLLQTISWPLVVVFILVYFGKPLKKFIENIGEFSFKAGASGLEATAKRQQIEAAALLGAASAKKSGESSVADDEDKAREIASVVSQVSEPGKTGRFAETSVLWVDDRPSNNIYERKALEALGIRFTISTSTEDALEKVKLGKYDAIISDMGRPPDNRAGYTLLSELQEQGFNMPFIVYASSNLPEHKAEARRRGAFGNTNNPQELFQLVTSAIR